MSRARLVKIFFIGIIVGFSAIIDAVMNKK